MARKPTASSAPGEAEKLDWHSYWCPSHYSWNCGVASCLSKAYTAWTLQTWFHSLKLCQSLLTLLSQLHKRKKNFSSSRSNPLKFQRCIRQAALIHKNVFTSSAAVDTPFFSYSSSCIFNCLKMVLQLIFLHW